MSIKKRTIVTGLIFLVLALLFPPYVYFTDSAVKGHGFIFAAMPDFINDRIVRYQSIDTPAFVIQIIIAPLLALLTNYIPMERVAAWLRSHRDLSGQ